MSTTRKALRMAIPIVVILAAGCASQADPGKEPAGWENLPEGGIAPWLKIDVDRDALTGAQPFVSTRPLPDSFSPIDGRGPTVILDDGLFKMWFEAERELFFTTSEDGTLWAEAVPVEILSDGWEGGRFGAPSVLRNGDRLEMWYVGDDGAGIGRALTRGEGRLWIAERTTLVPEQPWEGGASGRLGGPSVLLDEWAGRPAYRIWYTGWDRSGRGRIGHAVSPDGLRWTRIDGEGRVGAGPVAGPLGRVDPVVAADQPWEAGSVWTPWVMRDDTSQRRLYKMYYTGGRLADVEDFFNAQDVSIGAAGSNDGLQWEKIRAGINPVVGETFILDLGGIWLPYCPLGEDGPCPVRTLLSLVSSLIRYDEYDPAVVRAGDEYLMWFVQVDTLNYLVPPGGLTPPGIDNLRGLSLATSPPRLDF